MLLTIFMPMHPFIFALIDSKTLILWRDIVCLLALFIVIIHRHGKLKDNTIARCLLLSWIVGWIHAFIFHDSSMSLNIWLNTYRVYFMPSLVYFVMLNTKFSNLQIKKIKTVFLYECFSICVFGIIQQWFIGQDFIQFMGYRRVSITFAYGIQRNIGLFSSANIMGVYLIFGIIICLELIENGKKRFDRVVLGTLVAGLVFTISLSSYLAFIIILLVRTVMIDGISSRAIRRIFKYVGVLFALICILLIWDKIFFESKMFEQMLKRVKEISLVVTADNMLSITDISAAEHLNSLISGFNIMKNNFWGVGFSTGTFMVSNKISDAKYTVESSLFTILFDFGIIAGIIYYIPFLYASVKSYNRNISVQSARLMFLAILIVFIFLPIVQSYELRYFLFLFLGLSRNELYYKTQF